MRTLILVITIILLSVSFTSKTIGQSNTGENNTLRLSIGKFYSAILEAQNFYGAGAYTRKFGKFEIGAQAGFRYEALQFTHLSPEDKINIIGKSDDYKTNYPFGPSVFITTDIGDLHPTFKESRFFQSFFHLFLERNFKIANNISASLALGPSIEYGDIVFPAHEQDARISGLYGKDIQMRIYDYLLHRYIAFGWMGSGRLKYDFGNLGVVVGFEYSHYPDGNRVKSPFLEVIVPF